MLISPNRNSPCAYSTKTMNLHHKEKERVHDWAKQQERDGFFNVFTIV
jgi:hypothetical protein